MIGKFSVDSFRKNFPILDMKLPNGKQLIYFDNAATTQKPRCVIDAITNFYLTSNANIDRGLHYLGNLATTMCDAVRVKTAKYFNVNKQEIVFVRGATEGLNLLAHCLGSKFLSAGDEVLIGASEHHANIVPWQIACKQVGAKLRMIQFTQSREIDLDALKGMMSERVKIVSVQHIGNVFGNINPIEEIAEIAHKFGALCVIDGAASLKHGKLDLQKINCDFFVFSGHKGFAPTGIGVVYGKYDLLDQLSPYQTGGTMLQKITLEDTTFLPPPERFEAGTLDIAGIIGLGAAIDFLNSIDWNSAKEYEALLVKKLDFVLSSYDNVSVYANRVANAGIFSFNVNNLHAHDVATVFDSEGIAIRAGNHCAQPLMRSLGVHSTARISLALYNTVGEIDHINVALEKCFKLI